jgi:cyclic pyranopterin phosphate synthase
MTSNFCGDCNRIRLTADGKMKNCLFAEKETDLLTALRNGEDIVSLIHQNIRSKAKELGGQFTADFEHLHPEEIHNRSMITIGG